MTRARLSRRQFLGQYNLKNKPELTLGHKIFSAQTLEAQNVLAVLKAELSVGSNHLIGCWIVNLAIIGKVGNLCRDITSNMHMANLKI